MKSILCMSEKVPGRDLLDELKTETETNGQFKLLNNVLISDQYCWSLLVSLMSKRGRSTPQLVSAEPMSTISDCKMPKRRMNTRAKDLPSIYPQRKSKRMEQPPPCHPKLDHEVIFHKSITADQKVDKKVEIVEQVVLLKLLTAARVLVRRGCYQTSECQSKLLLVWVRIERAFKSCKAFQPFLLVNCILICMDKHQDS